ncbi:MAG: peptidase T [Anaerolineales bacterium]|nr:MAG: peptidase T [Anaerolineales bacterium]
MNRPVILVHGGAWTYQTGTHQAHVDGCRHAASAGWKVLESGGSALDAVEAAVRVMEDDVAFDAGRGSNFNLIGDIEMDAIIMDGKTLDFGAVAAVQRVRNPISLARQVMTQSPHSMFVGSGAIRFAQDIGFPMCDPDDLMGTYEPETPVFMPTDTVGAVALDADGNLAVATSTGGTAAKRPGRVGDSPIIGSGAYADNASAAASATGWGEKLMRIVTSKTACDYVTQGKSAQQAAEQVIAYLADRVGGYGGIIMIDHTGRVGISHNTQDMAYAYVTSEGLVSGERID